MFTKCTASVSVQVTDRESSAVFPCLGILETPGGRASSTIFFPMVSPQQ